MSARSCDGELGVKRIRYIERRIAPQLSLRQVVTGFIFTMPVLICLLVLSRFWKHLLRVGGLLSRGLRVSWYIFRS